MTSTYIQEKLLEKHICRFNDGECNCDCYIAGMTDYHNHIVEKINNYELNWNDSSNVKDGILSLLQDTNPSGEYEKALDNHFPGIQDSLDKLTIRDTNPKE